jgi:hypothetical protein
MAFDLDKLREYAMRFVDLLHGLWHNPANLKVKRL